MTKRSSEVFKIQISDDDRKNNFNYSLSDKKLWNILDVSEYTGFAKGTIYNLTAKNIIPHRKKRRKLFFIPKEIQNWIDEGDY